MTFSFADNRHLYMILDIYIYIQCRPTYTETIMWHHNHIVTIMCALLLTDLGLVKSRLKTYSLREAFNTH